MTIQATAKPNILPSINLSKYRLQLSGSLSSPVKARATIPEEGKAGSSFIKEVIVNITPQGIKVDLIK